MGDELPKQLTVVSPAKSWRGWRLPELLRRNKDLIKATLGVVFAALTAAVSGQLTWQAAFIIIGVAIIALLGKLLQDAVDFYFTEVELPQ